MDNSGEYISREAAIEAMYKDAEAHPGHTFWTSQHEALMGIPAADVRPVVLCRDCVHFQQFRPHDGFCNIDGMLWNNDFFCANGEKKEES